MGYAMRLIHGCGAAEAFFEYLENKKAQLACADWAKGCFCLFYSEPRVAKLASFCWVLELY